MSDKRLLVICFSFPPSDGIGGRRWAKFANYIHHSGVEIQVLTAKYNGTKISDWQKDTIELQKENRVHFFETGYPSVIMTIPKSIFQKLKYHLTLAYLKIKIKGNYYDRSALCKDNLLQEVEKFIKKGYTDIIISVGPFMYSKHLLAIRENHPEVKLILDVRDPWTSNKTAFGYSTLSPERFRFEKEAERMVAEGYDKILTVADDIGSYFVSEYGIESEKVITIKNGFDPLDFKELSVLPFTKKTLIFTGNLYQKAENSFLIFVNQLKKMKTDKSDFFNQYECHFYGEIHPSFSSSFSSDINLFFHGKISLNEVFEKIAQSSACLLFLTDDLNYSFSTKFYEYLSQRKPILIYSKPGKTGKFVEENNIGMQADEQNLEEFISYLEEDIFYKRPFDISEFDVSNLAYKLLSTIGYN